MMFFYLISQLLAAQNCLSIDHCIECDPYDEEMCAKCGQGYIASYYQCYECHKTCKNCNYDVTAEYCTECFEGYFLEKYYSSDEYGSCKPCSEDGLCKKCETKYPNTCTECVEKHYLDKASNKCLPCHSSCETCSGGDETECLTCIEGYIKIENLCKSCGQNCIECENADKCKTCEEKYFLDSSSQCQKCDDTCKTCHGNTANDCDECIDGYYNSNSNGLCRLCDANCEKCSGDRTHCISCKDGKYLDKETSTCMNCDIKCKTCTEPDTCDSCADGYVRESAKSECTKCDSKCGNCAYFNDGYYNELYCTTCAKGYYPEKVTYIDGAVRCQKTGVTGCLVAISYSECQTCEQKYYKNGGKCSKCHDSCLACDKANACTSCEQGYYLDESSLCDKCSDNCISCKSKNNCTHCADNYYNSDGICMQCDKSCDSCNDGSNACIECAVGYFFNEFKRCVKCSDNCDECTDVTHCTNCAPEFFIASDGSCSPCADVCFECTGPTADDCYECDPGFYLSKSLMKCFKCNEACTVCNGPNDYDCTECAPGYFLNKNMEISPDKEADKCTKCENGCKNCTSTTKCTECQEGFYFINENCEHCPLGCKSCTEGVQKCTECFDGYYVSSTDGKLVNCSRCPTGCDSCNKDESGKLTCNSCFVGYYFKDKRCVKCTSPCSTCTSDTECTSCIKGHLLEGTSCSSQCSSSCASCQNAADSCTECNDGFILNGTICLQCPDDCKTCEIEGETSQCTSCFEGYYLHNGKCKKCYYECATCSDSSVYCYTCKEGYYKYTQNSNYYGLCEECYLKVEHCTKCISDFPEGDLVFTCLECEDDYFLKDNKCEQCHSSCKTCDGTTEQNCLTCHDEFFLVDGKCLPCSDSCLTCSTSPTTCASCRSHQYLSNGQCFDCSDSCAECKDSNTCTKCPESKFLHEGKCINSCLEAGEGWGDNGNHECVKCNIENCNKYDESCKCTSCIDGYYYESDPITLIELCLPCKLSNCKTCSGSELNDCTECMHGYELQENGDKFCHQICEEGYFVNASSQCEKCHSPCKICSGVDGSICNQCEDGYFLVNNVCSAFPIDCELQKHCENENKGDSSVHLTINITNFESFNHEQSGGALRIINCGVTGENIKFNDCTSQKGGGGAIFIFNEKEIDQPITLTQITFTSCKAAYGGAVYIYSISESPISIISCTFTDNDVYSSTGSSDSPLFGGSAIYLTVKNGAVSGCTFIKKHKLNAGMIKITENFDDKPKEPNMLHLKEIAKINLIEITECSFEINDNSSSSIVYVVEKQTVNCVSGHRIANGVHISEDKKRELNKQLVEINLANSKESNEKKELLIKFSSSTKILMTIALFGLVAVIATIIITKRDQSRYEMNNDSIDSINA